MDGDVGLERCVFSCHHRPGPSPVSPIHSRGPSLSIPGPSVRPLVCTTSIYETDGCCRSTSPPPRHNHLPVPRRLASGSVFTNDTAPTSLSHHFPTRELRHSYQLQEVLPGTCSNHSIHRSSPEFPPGPSLLTPRQGRHHYVTGLRATQHPDNHSSSCPTSLGTYGRGYDCHSACPSPNATPATVVQSALQPSSRCSKQKIDSAKTDTSFSPLVALPRASAGRIPFFVARSYPNGDDRCIPMGLGSSYRHRLRGRPLAADAPKEAHQLSRAHGYLLGPDVVLHSSARENGSGFVGQYDCGSLPQPSGRHNIPIPLSASPNDLEFLHPTLHPSGGSPSAGKAKLHSRLPQQGANSISRDGAQLGLSGRDICAMGNTRHRRLCHTREQKVQGVLLSGGDGPSLSRRRSSSTLDGSESLHVSPNTTNRQNLAKTVQRTASLYSDSSVVAAAGLVSVTPTPGRQPLHFSAHRSGPPCSGGATPAYQRPEIDGVANSTLVFSAEVQHVLLHSRKDSTRRSYSSKWERFSDFLSSRKIPPTSSSLSDVCEFLLSLKSSGLSHSSLRVYLAAISAYHPPIDGFAIFSHPLMKRFFQGLVRLYPPVRTPPPAWDLPLVLRRLTRHPFEPMASCDLRLLTWKTAFLVAITSARRVSELVALCRIAPYLIFQPHSVRLRPDATFLPKVVSQFHLSADIILPDFFPTPSSDRERLLHTLDVKRALLFYLDRTKATATSHRLFLTYAPHHVGMPVSSQRFSKWISATIALCYELERVPVPGKLLAHSTRKMASSHAFFDNVSLEDICAAATWASPSTFIRHYAIDVRAQRTAPVARSVLQAATLGGKVSLQ